MGFFFIILEWEFFEQVNSLPFNHYTWLTTHNSFARLGARSATGSVILAPSNQQDSITSQLNVRYCLSFSASLLLFFLILFGLWDIRGKSKVKRRKWKITSSGTFIGRSGGESLLLTITPVLGCCSPALKAELFYCLLSVT